jgi:hypothetical protein
VPDVRRLHDVSRRERDDVEFTFRAGRWNHLGEATLANRIKSHPDVGQRWVSLNDVDPGFSFGQV